MTSYLFTSQRLGFRNWRMGDLPRFAEMNRDSEVMKYFPHTLRLEESIDFLKRLIVHYETHGYNYFATEVLDTGELIGFIGMALQDYDAVFNPSTDIGWRLVRSAWGKGYATEGAQRCVAFAFQQLDMDRITSVCSIGNIASENVMTKIGMTKKGEFLHPKLRNHPNLAHCVWYEIQKNGAA